MDAVIIYSVTIEALSYLPENDPRRNLFLCRIELDDGTEYAAEAKMPALALLLAAALWLDADLGNN